MKVAILLGEPWRVFYQDNTKFPFHYDFATLRLPPFTGMDRASFEAVSLRRPNQQIVLGALLYPPRATFVEYGIQFIGLDAYTPDEIARWFELVKATVYATNGAGAVRNNDQLIIAGEGGGPNGAPGGAAGRKFGEGKFGGQRPDGTKFGGGDGAPRKRPQGQQ